MQDSKNQHLFRFTSFTYIILAVAAMLLLGSWGRPRYNDTLYSEAGAAAFQPAVSAHHINLNGVRLNYRATAGYLLVNDERQQPLANIFYTAYTTDSGSTRRPVTFVFNGGPGSASIWLHMGAFGPVRTVPGKSGYRDNPDSWLNFTDLVFIDPVGTGYSRPADGIPAAHFYSYREDIRVIAKFIRLYQKENHRQSSPLFLTGESYGGARAVGLAAYLQDSLHINVSGLTLISPALNYKQITFSKENTAPYVYYLSGYALTAQYYHKLSPLLQELHAGQLVAISSTFAQGAYKRFLNAGGIAPAEVIDTLSYFTGLSKTELRRINGHITDNQFTHLLLKNKQTGVFDSRANSYNLGIDPSEADLRAVFPQAFEQYVHQNLHYMNHLFYNATIAAANWNYGTKTYLNVTATLKNLLLEHPDLRVQIAGGYYDLATPVGTITKAVNDVAPNEHLRTNVDIHIYHSGHMIYTDDHANTQFRKDSERFYKKTL